MSDIKLGRILGDNEKRDAIHVAIAPVWSRQVMRPGQRVSLVLGSSTQVQATEPSQDSIGIVDPFLEGGIAPHQKFWILLFQGTTTGLRHDWSHPKFKDDQDLNADYDSNDECRNCYP